MADREPPTRSEDSDLRAYGPYVTRSDIDRWIETSERNTKATKNLIEAIEAHDGLVWKTRALTTAIDRLNDTIEKLCHGMGISTADPEKSR